MNGRLMGPCRSDRENAIVGAILLGMTLLGAPAAVPEDTPAQQEELPPAEPAQQEPAGAEIPIWFLRHIETLTAGSGRWIASNAAYQSDDEPYDEYGIEWRKGLGGKTARGRLFGLANGKEIGDFWEFVLMWHPGLRQAQALQFGSDGTFGIGPLTWLAEHSHTLDQEFYRPDGSRFRAGHRSRVDEGRQEASSFDIHADGTWMHRRSYVWVLE